MTERIENYEEFIQVCRGVLEIDDRDRRRTDSAGIL